jgi:hypothetical protein
MLTTTRQILVSATVVAVGLVCGPAAVSAQEPQQALREEIDQLRQDFEALKQQYGDRLTALESKLAAVEAAGLPPQPANPQPPAPPSPPAT